MTSRKAGRKALSADVAAEVRRVMTTLLQSRYDGVNARLGAALGISGQAVGKTVSGSASPAVSTALEVAKLAGDSQLSQRIADDIGMWGRIISPSERYPNLVKCLEFQNRWEPAVIAAAREGAYPDDVPPPEWAERLDRLAAALATVRTGTN